MTAKNVEPFSKQMLNPAKKNLESIKNKISHYIFSIYGNGDTIRIGKEVQCLLYWIFLIFFRIVFELSFKLIKVLKKSYLGY